MPVVEPEPEYEFDSSPPLLQPEPEPTLPEPEPEPEPEPTLPEPAEEKQEEPEPADEKQEEPEPAEEKGSESWVSRILKKAPNIASFKTLLQTDFDRINKFINTASTKDLLSLQQHYDIPLNVYYEPVFAWNGHHHPKTKMNWTTWQDYDAKFKQGIYRLSNIPFDTKDIRKNLLEFVGVKPVVPNDSYLSRLIKIAPNIEALRNLYIKQSNGIQRIYSFRDMHFNFATQQDLLGLQQHYGIPLTVVYQPYWDSSEALRMRRMTWKDYDNKVKQGIYTLSNNPFHEIFIRRFLEEFLTS